jgi:flagellar basal-body rod modification protein FlgD
MQSIQETVTGTSQLANSASNVAGALARPRVASSGGPKITSDTASSSEDDASTITANDFLTLLVAEMKNQDPTQPTDPNAYISQMVSVNSLQQLIGINQGITSLDAAAGVETGAAASAIGRTAS